MASLRTSLRRFATRMHLRPWALLGPTLVLMVCLPLLRPVRHPDPRGISDYELATLATVEAIVERHTLAINGTHFAEAGPGHAIKLPDGKLYTDQPMVLPALLSGAYWVMYHGLGMNFAAYPIWVPYLLTVIAATVPVAGAGGLLYRMLRIFELSRVWRAALSTVMVLGSGLVSYGVVINGGAPAAVLLLVAAACLVSVAGSEQPQRGGGWLAVAGFAAGLAATFDLSAGIFLLAFVGVIFAMRLTPSLKVGGALLYLVGAVPALALHAVLTVPITGDMRPGFMHRELAVSGPVATTPSWADVEDDDADGPTGPMQRVERFVGWLLSAALGRHGLLTHFPLLIVAGAGVATVMHRHWPATTKVLASVTAGGALAIVLFYAAAQSDWHDAMFASRWFVVFLPLMCFWAGAWVRKGLQKERGYHPAAWALAGLAAAFSVAVAVLGATDPQPREGFDRYTVAGVAKHLGAVEPIRDVAPVLAGR